MKKILKIVAIIVVVFAVVSGLAIFITIRSLSTSHPERLEGNADKYSVENTDMKADSLLKGKTIIFLGSSVTYGSDAMGQSFVDFMEKMDGINVVKEAVSGTTLVDKKTFGKESYITRMKNISTEIKADAFICQLSTNDATMKLPLGEISESTDMETFDTKTVIGAMEYVIAYAKKTWDCPVIFYTGTQYTTRGYKEYQQMIDALYGLQEKWDIGIIDLWNDEEMQAVSEDDYALYMSNGIHPTRAGYREWWTPKFESYLTDLFEENQMNLYKENPCIKNADIDVDYVSIFVYGDGGI